MPWTLDYRTLQLALRQRAATVRTRFCDRVDPHPSTHKQYRHATGINAAQLVIGQLRFSKNREEILRRRKTRRMVNADLFAINQMSA